MELSTYLATLSDVDKRNFADRCGLHPNYLWTIARRWRAAGVRATIAIERESGGAVTARDLRPDLYGGVLELRKAGGGVRIRRSKKDA